MIAFSTSRLWPYVVAPPPEVVQPGDAERREARHPRGEQPPAPDERDQNSGDDQPRDDPRHEAQLGNCAGLDGPHADVVIQAR